MHHQGCFAVFCGLPFPAGSLYNAQAIRTYCSAVRLDATRQVAEANAARGRSQARLIKAEIALGHAYQALQSI
jgi:hypothetical protein